MFKKVISSVLICVLFCSLCGCSISKTPSDFITLIGKGKAVDIRYHLCDKNSVNEVKGFSNAVFKRTGFSMTPVTDIPEDNPEEVEVIYGITNISEGCSVHNKSRYTEYGVRVCGNKVVIFAPSEELRKEAKLMFLDVVNEFYDNDAETLRLPKNFERTKINNPYIDSLPLIERKNGTQPSVSDMGDDCYTLRFDEMSKAKFDEACSSFEAIGYKLRTENRIEENCFKTYSDGQTIAEISLDKKETLRLILQPLFKTDLPPLKEENIYEDKGYTTLFTQIGLYYDAEGKPKTEYANGMSYTLRLADGSFIVIDGGHRKEIDADRLYSVMRKHVPENDKVVIAAWIFTHAHGDHVGFFPKFTKKYGDKVIVEQFIYNFPSREDAKSGNGDRAVSTRTALEKNVYNNSKQIKAHWGQKYYVRNAEIEILMSYDLLKPQELSYYNNCSLACIIEIDRKKIFITGDCGTAAEEVLSSIFTEKTLQSDVVQVSHHGIISCFGSLYDVIKPEYAFWPVGAYKVKYSSTPLNLLAQNDYIVNVMNSENVFLAEDNIVLWEVLENGNIATSFYDTDSEYLS